jgi:dTMP kinase
VTADGPLAFGRFVAFEGGEGCGKSTQAALLAQAIGAQLTREPGGTPLGTSVRALLLDPDAAPVGSRTEALLMAADRAHHVATVVRPALESGRHVVSDRFAASSIAYQGYGRGLPVGEIRELSAWATDGLWPDLNVLVDVPVDVAAARLGTDLDRFERAGDEFHERVAEGFRRLAADDPEHWVVVDGTPTVEEVAAAVRVAVEERLDLTA